MSVTPPALEVQPLEHPNTTVGSRASLGNKMPSCIHLLGTGTPCSKSVPAVHLWLIVEKSALWELGCFYWHSRSVPGSGSAGGLVL